MTNAIEQAKAKIAASKTPIVTPQAVAATSQVLANQQEAQVINTPAPQQEVVSEKTYQVYKSSLPNQGIPMPNGKVIRITSSKYITDKEDEIEFLDTEIKAGFPYLAKNGTVTSADLDPMSALRTKIIAEYVAEQEAGGAKVPSPKLSNVPTAKLTPNHTGALNKLASGSNSVAE